MICLDEIRPHITPEFLASFRKLGKQVGYRNLGRAIAYLPADSITRVTGRVRATESVLSTTPSISQNGNGHKAYTGKVSRNRRKQRFDGPRCYECTRVDEAGRQVADTHRYQHRIKFPFTHAVRVKTAVVNENVEAIAAWLPSKKCCGQKMGIMPTWDGTGRWRYQCETRPLHYSDVEIVIWAKAQRGA